jgi:hypothetical protein
MTVRLVPIEFPAQCRNRATTVDERKPRCRLTLKICQNPTEFPDICPLGVPYDCTGCDYALAGKPDRTNHLKPCPNCGRNRDGNSDDWIRHDPEIERCYECRHYRDLIHGNMNCTHPEGDGYTYPHSKCEHFERRVSV